jgi:hypothetical protein
MTEMPTTVSDNSSWNNILSDQFFDLNDLFSSTFGLIHHDEDDQESMLIEEEDKETLSSSAVNISQCYLFDIHQE